MIQLAVIPPCRGTDKHGSGHFGASRGNRKHNGVDISVPPSSIVLSLTSGLVTKVGYPYDPTDKAKGHFRYVEVTNNGLRIRYFYVEPYVDEGQLVRSGSELGESQRLGLVYPGITEHVHVEVKTESGQYLNPNLVLGEL